MKCPLIKKRAELEKGYEYDEPLDCLKEECAWWNMHNEECCLMSIGKVLNYMADHIHDIKDKMPPQEDNRK